MYRYQFQFYQSNQDNRWYWRLVRFLGQATSGDIIAVGSQGHPTKGDCEEEISHVKAASDAPVN